MALSLIPVLALLLPAGAGPEAKTWTTHVDPSFVSEIVLDDGRLYIATSGGLLIYRPSDGTFEQYTNTMGLPSNFLTALAFDEDGTLWVGTERSGIARLDRTADGFDVTPLSSTAHGLSDDQITDLAVWGDTLVYTTKKGAGLVYQGFSGTRFYERNGLPSDVVRAALVDGDSVWLATDKGLVYLDEFGFLRNPTDTLFPSFSLARTDTALWVGTDRGVAYLRDGAAKWVHYQLETVPRPVFSLAFHGGTLWAGARARLFRNDGAGWTQAATLFGYYGKDKYDLNNTVCEMRTLQPMPEGGVFFGAGDPGGERRGVYLLHFDGAALTQVAFNGLPANRLVRLAYDIDESLWVSTRVFGIAKLTPSDEWVVYNSASGDTNLSSRYNNLAFLADSQGSKWFCTLSSQSDPLPLDELRDGLDTDRSNDEWKHYTTQSGLGSLRNQNAAEDPEGNRWFLSDEIPEAPGWWGISILSRDGSEWVHVTPQTTDPSGRLLAMKAGNVTDVAFGPGGIVYVALKTYGVQRWVTGGYDLEHLFDLTDDVWTTAVGVGSAGGIASGASIFSLALRSDGALWIGTDVGLYRLFGGLAYIPRNQGFGPGLLGSRVADVLLDRSENLWVATDLGLNRISRSNINDIASYTTPTVYQTQLSLFFPPSVVSQIADATCEWLALHPSRDILCIATGGGLSVLDITFPDEREDGPAVSARTYVYPNPIEPRKGHSSLKIGNIDTEVLVEIYTVEGELVHSATVSNAGDKVWDLSTKSDLLAASGVYIVRISAGGDVVTRTVSLIR